MAIYRCNTSTGTVGSGSSHSDYIHGKNKYAYKENEIVYSYDFLPNNVSDEVFWKTADNNEPIMGNRLSRVYREYKLTLPHELSLDENIELINEFIEKELGSNYYYSVVIHDKESSEKGINNIHAHLMFSERKIDGIDRPLEQFFHYYNRHNPHKGGARKEPSWKTKEKLFEIRQSWEDVLNKHLEVKGIEKVSCKTLAKQKEEAIKDGDMVKAEFCDRNPCHINGYLLKKDINKMTENELDEFNNYLLNKDILDIAKVKFKEEREKQFTKKAVEEINTQTDTIINSLNKNKSVTFNELKNIESDFAMLQKEKFRLEYNQSDSNLHLETIKKIDINYYHLEIEKDTLLSKYLDEDNPDKKDIYLEKLSNIQDSINALPDPRYNENYNLIKQEFSNELEKKLDNLHNQELVYENKFRDIKLEIGEQKFAQQKLEQEFNVNYSNLVDIRFNMSSLNKKMDSYKNYLDKDKLIKTAINIYSKGEYNKVYNRYNSLKKEFDTISEKLNKLQKNGSEFLSNSKKLNEVKIKLDKITEVKKEFDKKYLSTYGKKKILTITRNVESKYKDLYAKVWTDYKILKLQEETLSKKIISTPKTKEEVKNIINEYKAHTLISNSKVEIQKMVVDHLKKIDDKKIEDLTLNKLSKGEYFLLAKNYKILADRFNELNHSYNGLKFYEIDKKVSINTERKEIKEKLENMSNRYFKIKELSENKSETYISEFNNLKNSFLKVEKEQNNTLKDLKNISFENSTKEKYAFYLSKEIDTITDNSIYVNSGNETEYTYSFNTDFSNDYLDEFLNVGDFETSSESGGGGSISIGDDDKDKWKNRKKNMFEQGNSF